jgi:linoleoyl-CoA desaturase
MYTTGATQCFTPYLHQHYHDEDLDAGRVIRFTKEAKWYNFHRFQQYYSVLYGLLTFNWAITTDFKQMRSYLKRKYRTAKLKAQNTLDYFNYYQNNLCFYLDCFTNRYWNHLVESAYWFLVMHYTAGLILSIVFQLAHVEETTNPSPNELGEMDNT